MSISRGTLGQRLKREIEWLAMTTTYDKANDEPFVEHLERAYDLLGRLSPETMTAEQIAKRWPNILTAMIVESLGYFTPRSAAHALQAFKLNEAFGCEMYCAAAGFERDGWPRDPAEYRAKLVATGRRVLQRAVQCRAGRRYPEDLCWYEYPPLEGEGRRRGPSCLRARQFHADHLGHAFVETESFGQHKMCGQRHMRRHSGEWRYARQLVQEMAQGAPHPPAILASYF